nr:putative ribonuclease H-like domain-containing protein [Tanacetum cinerariifolium]
MKELCNAFERLMHEKFQMSFIVELTFFLGLQVKQKKDGIFISQDKYVSKILKKFRFTEAKTASTPMETQKPLLKDEDGEEVDVHMYRSIIGSLMYLTSSRPDIMFTIDDGKAFWNRIGVNIRRIDAIDQHEYITLVNVQDDAEMFDVNDLGGEEVFVAEQEVVSVAATTVTTEELTLAQALDALKTSKPKVKWIVIQEHEEPGKSTTTISKQQSQDKGKAIMIEEPVKPEKKDQIKLDEETAKRLQAKFDDEERLARERERERSKRTRSQHCFD